MPSQAEWLLRLPEIRAALERIEAPVVDRAGIEKLFGVRRRRAIAMMHTLGGYQAGRTFLVERSALLARLAALEGAEDYHIEKRRRERLAGFVERSREHLCAAQVVIPVRDATTTRTLTALGPGVDLCPGALHIEFTEPAELLEKLYGLSQAIAREFETFAAMAKSPAASD